MKLKVLLLPFALVVLVGAGRQAEAITDADREVMEQMSTMVCAQRAAVAAAGYEVSPIDRARASVMLHVENAEEKRKANAFFSAVKRKCG